jgi:cobalt-precorrin 5A hydrolase
MKTPLLRLALGLGCDRGTPVATIAEVVDAALAEVAATYPCASLVVAVAASIDLKANEAGLLQLATTRGWPLFFYPATRLATVPVPNPSATVLRHTGTPSVSEAAALLAAGQAAPKLPGQAAAHQVAVHDSAAAPMSQLLIEKLRRRGPDGRNATVSIARIV